MTDYRFDPAVFDRAGGTRVTVQAGQTVFREGEPGDVMYYLRDGEIEIAGENGTLATLWPGDFFGEMSMIDGSPRSATATAKSDCALVAVDRRQFLDLVRDTPDIAMHMLQVLTVRVRELNCLI